MMKPLLLSILVLAGITATAQTVPNSGFESWVTNSEGSVSYSVPQSWIPVDPFETYLNDLFGNPNYTIHSTTQTSTAHSGNYAVQMAVAVSNTGDTIGGALFSAPTCLQLVNALFNGAPATGFPLAQRPANLNFYYKKNTVGNDTCGFEVIITKWNSTTHTRDTLMDQTRYMNTAANWTMYSFPLTYAFNEYPDTMLIAGGIYGNNGAYHIGTLFTVDDFTFSGNVPIGIEEHSKLMEAVVYPNPFSETARIELHSRQLENGTFELFDVLGNKVRGMDGLTGTGLTIDREGLPAGIYFYQLVDAGKMIAAGKLSVK